MLRVVVEIGDQVDDLVHVKPSALTAVWQEAFL
jgi:hypothetical protein